ncbi:MAG: ligase-associated DNA damage response DEXH box helicase, partial [Dokdonella sp.]
LIHAPTGSGKTLAAFGGPLIDALADSRNKPGLSLIWITPLRALASDLRGQLEMPLRDIGSDWRVLTRTGDSSATDRARLRRGAAEIVITTPESLEVLLSHADATERLAGVRSIIVDEWHELLANKRGVLLQLSLARLRRIAPALRLWGLSATLGNLDVAMQALLGPNGQGRLISDSRERKIAIDSVLPQRVEKFAWAGHLGLSQLRAVAATASAARSCLVFTNTRSQAELWHEALAAVWPHAAGTLAVHHGSLDRELRLQIEDALRDGSIRCVVATSSLDLGVDFAAVDQVIQIGSPRGVARLLQRAGRSNHRPGETSRILCVPTMSLELAEIAAIRRAIKAGDIEARIPFQLCVDVLAQHLTTMAIAGGFREDEMLAEVRETYAYATLDMGLWKQVLQFLENGGSALQGYPDYQRVVEIDGEYHIATARIAKLHRYNIGTIVADGSIGVRFLPGGRLGSVEEAFIARMKPGDRFLFAGRSLELVRVRDMTAWVRLVRGSRGDVPRWMGGRIALSNELGPWLQQVIADEKPAERELRALAPVLKVQLDRSALPRPDQLLVEVIHSRGTAHVFLYPFAGRRVHEGLGALLALRLSRMRPATIAFGVNDYGLMLTTLSLPELDESIVRNLLDRESVRDDLLASIAGGELARRQFREIARVAGLVFSNQPGHDRSVRHLQAGTGLIHDVLAAHEPEHLLLR